MVLFIFLSFNSLGILKNVNPIDIIIPEEGNLIEDDFVRSMLFLLLNVRFSRNHEKRKFQLSFPKKQSKLMWLRLSLMMKKSIALQFLKDYKRSMEDLSVSSQKPSLIKKLIGSIRSSKEEMKPCPVTQKLSIKSSSSLISSRINISK